MITSITPTWHAIALATAAPENLQVPLDCVYVGEFVHLAQICFNSRNRYFFLNLIDLLIDSF